MAGKGKGFVWQDYQTAFEMAWHGPLSLDEPIKSNQTASFGGGFSETRLDHTPSISPTPEEELINKDMFYSLSKESKEIVKIILDSPSEVIDCFITPKYNKISKKLVKRYLVENGWDVNTVRSCFHELKDFCSELC